MTRAASLALAALLLGGVGDLIGIPTTASWPQFRGVNAAGVAPDATPPLRVGPKEKARWSVEVPWSPSSPVVSGDNLFLTTFHDSQLYLRTATHLWAFGE